MLCNKNCQRKCDETLKERLFNIYISFNQGNNKFILLLRIRVYAYEYLGDWEKLNKASLPEKEDFYSYLNTEDSIDADYEHAKRVCKD